MIVALSDDLTGAVACAAELGASGATVCVRRWDQPSPSRPVDAIVIDTESRPLSRPAAVGRVRSVVVRLRERLGEETDWYKRFDSHLAGHWAVELASMADVLDRPCLIAPLALDLGAVNERKANELQSALADEVCAVDPSVHPDDLASALATAPFVLCQARDREELVRLAVTVEDLPPGTRFICAGTFGFARSWAAVRTVRARIGGRSGSVLAVVGSVAAASQGQLARLGDFVVRSDAADALTEVHTYIRDGRDVILTVPPATDPHLQKLVPAAASHLADVAIDSVRLAPPKAMILVGGDLASALNQRAGTGEIEAFSEPWPAIPAVRFAGGYLDDTIGILKSGRLGSHAWLENAIALLRPRKPRRTT